MNIYANPNSAFPSQTVSDIEKSSEEYGRQVAQAIEGEWWQQGGNGTRFATSFNRFHTLRLYARGEQPVQKYKDELAINGDLSYLNLDWKPVPILSKFVELSPIILPFALIFPLTSKILKKEVPVVLIPAILPPPPPPEASAPSHLPEVELYFKNLLFTFAVEISTSSKS